jgi:hypothetical protein
MATDNCTVPSATCCLVLNPKYNPNPPRIGYRSSTCNTLYPDATNIITPEQEELIKQQYKGNILQYKGNSSNYSKRTIYSKIIQGGWSNRKRCYASQGVKYTNPNTNFFAQSGNSNILLNGNPTNYPVKCPPYSNLVYYNSNQRADPDIGVISNGGVFLCNKQVNPCSGYVKTNLPVNYCFSTSCSNVPGKEMLLCYKSTNNTYYPKPKRVMTDVGGKFPINYKQSQCSSANATPSEVKNCG